MNIAVIGHVESGKSTTTGHLVYNVTGSTREQLKSSRRRLPRWERAPFKYAGPWTN